MQVTAQTTYSTYSRSGSCGTSSNICTEPSSYHYKTVKDGAWSSASTWLNGYIPPTNLGSYKKVLIRHNVTRPGTFKPASNSFLVIKSGGVFTTDQILTDYSNATIIVKDGRINVMNGNFQITTSSSSVCAINSCIYVKNGDFQFEQSYTEMNFDNTGIHLVNGNLQSKAKVTGSGIRVKLQNGNFERNGGTWAGSTVAAWYSSGSVNGFSGLPTESSSSLEVCSGAYVDALNDIQNIAAGSTGTTSVLANDRYNGNPATLANVTLTQISTNNAGVTLDTTTGLVAVAAGTSAGTYTLTYKICSVDYATVCDTATVTVKVGTTVNAVDDEQTIADGNTGTISVLDNDTVNGADATFTNVTLTQLSTTNAGVTLNTTTGLISVATGTPAGEYEIVYKICSKAYNCYNICDSATVTVTVGANITATDDAQTLDAGTTGTVSVLNNDTLNGAAATLANVTLTQVSTTNTGVNIDTTTGLVSVAAGTPAGTYEVVYQICSQLSPTSCDTATVTVTVNTTIDAVNDAETISTGSAGTVSVLNNDTLNGAAATLSNVNLTQVSTTNAGVTLDTATGLVAVATGTPAGTYDVVYQICSQTNTTVCDTATVQVTVPGNVDLAMTVSTTRPFIVVNDDNAVFYTVSNVGTSATTGSTITINVGSPTANGGELSISTPLPQGWTLVSQSGNTFVFNTTKVIAPGASDTFVFNYFVDNLSSPNVVFVGDIADAAGEVNTSNNNDSMLLNIINL